MVTVGITGGIGSGKSTACKVFGILGIPVFQADVIAGKLQNEDSLIKESLTNLFGKEIYTAESLLDRRKLASIVFNNKQLLEKLNSIIHPAVQLEFLHWKEKFVQKPYILYEAAILFETGSFRKFDFTILVVADEKERIERVIKRDHSNVKAVLMRMHHQMHDTEKRELADFIIENNDNQLIIPQILKLDQILKSNSHVWKMDR
jgi:dephospho-CoA kinase